MGSNKDPQVSPTVLVFAERLRDAIRDGGGRAEFSRKSGINARLLSRYANADTEPGLAAVDKIAKASGRAVSWFFGQDELNLGANLSPELVMIPRYDVRASAGAGALVSSEEISEFLAFRRDWLKRIGVSPDHSMLAELSGDSMEPTIPDGALILINTAVQQVMNGFIYAIRRDEELLVKRVQIKMDRTVVLIPDNPLYEREEFSPDRAVDLHVIGQVVWNAYALVGRGRL